MNARQCLLRAGWSLAVLALIAAPVAAQTIPAGIDVWTTKNDGNTWADFSNNPLPANFFCPGSPAFAQVVPLRGLPIVTNPAGVLNQTDTIIQRLQSVTFSNGVGSTPIQVRAVCFQEKNLLSIACSSGTTTFKTRVRINPNVSAVTTMTIYQGGTYDASLVVPGLVSFINTATGQSTAEAPETVNLSVTGASWASQPGTGGVTWGSSVTVAQGCNASPNLTLPGVSPNFAAGWSGSCNPPCPTVVQHNGPHPVTPVPPPPPCPRIAIDAQKLSSRTYAGTQVLTVQPTVQAVACQVEPVGEVLQVIGPDANVKAADDTVK